jgi:hypothetical protein
VPAARPNVFQRLARTWDVVHPYNAAHACRVVGAFDRERAGGAWRQTLSAFGFAAASAACVEDLGSDDDLARHLTHELNRPFDESREPPFRAFVQELGGSTWLSIVYQHWVADSYAVRLVLRDWIGRMAGDEAKVGVGKADAVRPRGDGGWAVPGALAVLRRHREYRLCRKIQPIGPMNYPTRVRLVETPVGLAPPLLAYAHRCGVKLNDVFLAALAEACDRFVPTQTRPGRTGVAVSTVADLRPTRPCDRRHRFGCHLGFGGVVCRPRDVADWDRLLRRVAACTAADRQAGFATASTVWMLAAEAGGWLTPPPRLYGFYRKEAPFLGGISNVNLRGTWFGRHHPGRVLDYVRVSPTGPIVPVALAVTTLGDDLRLSMTYRANLFNDWTAVELARAFVGRLTRVAC